MKRALLWMILMLLCIPSFSRLKTLAHDFPVECTTPFEITMDASKPDRAQYRYSLTPGGYMFTVINGSLEYETGVGVNKINKRRILSAGSSESK